MFAIHICRYEEAVTELKISLSNTVNPQSQGECIKLQTRPSTSTNTVAQLTAQQITESYTSLHSWDEASDWLKEFDTMKSTNGLLAGVDAVGYCDK